MNIEEIKKEIENEKNCRCVVPITNDTNVTKYIKLDTVMEILDKYQLMYPDYKELLYKNDSITTELQNYKSVWEELKESQSTNCAYVNLGEELEVRFEELEQKYKLGGE